MASTAVGPQSPNFTTARPPTDPLVSAVDTWFRDCSAAGANDGTIVTASWLNMVTAQLRTAFVSAGVVLDDTDDTMLWQAIQQAATAALAALSASRGLNLVGTDVQMDVGQESNGILNHLQIAPATDTVPVWDDDANLVKETSIYSLVRAALGGSTGITYDNTTGQITLSAPKHTVSNAAPAGESYGDTWMHPASGILYKWTTDGATDFWLQIS